MANSRTIFSIFIPLVLFSLFGCKKDKSKTIEGILLYSKSNPEPVRNYTLEMYQRGGNAILMGSASSSATTTTDNDGHFRFIFTPGKAYFGGIFYSSGAPTSLMGLPSSNYPGIYRDIFPDSAYNPNTPIYLVKEIQQYIVQFKALKNVVDADSVFIRVSTKAGEIERLYTGITIGAGTTKIVDTIKNVIATDLLILNGGYRNPFWLPLSRSNFTRTYFSNNQHIGLEDEPIRTSEIVIY